MEEPAVDFQDQIINEEYKIWKKNTPFLYDLVMTHPLEWPSLTVQWMPEVTRPTDREISIHKLLLGTHTSGSDPNYLMIADVLLPLPDAEIDARKYDDERGEVGGFGGVLSKIDIKIKMIHDGEVNKARIMPQRPSVIATMSPSNSVLIYDYHKHPSHPTENVCRPQFRCNGHNSEGYGLSWNPNTEGQLVSGADDGSVCVWDINNNPSNSQDVKPLLFLSSHTDVVEDVDWHQSFPHLCGSAGDDRRILLWDIRSPGKPNHSIDDAHKEEVNSIAFSKHNEYLFASGSSDKTVGLWDIRNMKAKVHSFESHTDSVTNVQWSPTNESILSSCGADRRVMVWDLSRIGDEQNPEDAEDGPPELLFVHGGHTAKVSDLSWNSNDPWVVASVAEDNVLQLWQLANNIYNDDEDDEVADDDLEPASGGLESVNEEDEEEEEAETKQKKKQRI